MRAILTVALASTLLWAGSSGLASAQPLPMADAPGQGPMYSDLTKCSSPADLNCVESIALVKDNGEVSQGILVNRGDPEPWPQVDPESGEFGLSKGHGVYRGDTWQVPGLKNEWGTEYLRPLIRLTEPGVQMTENGEVWDMPAGLTIELVPGSSKNSKNDQDFPVPGVEGCGTAEKPVVCRKLATLDPTQRIRVVVRTSWLEPAWASGPKDPVMTMERLKGGGSRMTAEGYPGPYVANYYPKSTPPGAVPDYDFYIWGAGFKDANDPYFPERCLADRFPIFSSNAYTLNTPTWNPQTRELTTSLAGPHFNSKGKLFRGYFDAQFPLELAKCLWDISPRLLKDKLTIEVFDEGGDEQAATSSMSIRSGYVRIAARNFHFSRPSIVIKQRGRR